MSRLEISDLLDEELQLLEVALEAASNTTVHPNGAALCCLISRISEDLRQIIEKIEN